MDRDLVFNMKSAGLILHSGRSLCRTWVETWGLGGRPPNKFEVGERPIRSPNILRSTVIGCEAKYELTKKRSQGEVFCSEIEVFGQEKGKNGHQKFILGVKMEFFP